MENHGVQRAKAYNEAEGQRNCLLIGRSRANEGSFWQRQKLRDTNVYTRVRGYACPLFGSGVLAENTVKYVKSRMRSDEPGQTDAP